MSVANGAIVLTRMTVARTVLVSRTGLGTSIAGGSPFTGHTVRSGGLGWLRCVVFHVTVSASAGEVSAVTCTSRASHTGNLRPTVVDMDNRAEVRDFLTTRRAKVTPRDAGLPDVGQRRVPGLRRGEVAALAGVSVEYYAKLERGALAGVSTQILDAIARALKLDDAERTHLFHLAQAADGSSAMLRPTRRSSTAWTPHPTLQWTLDTITGGPAIVRNGRMDLLATNKLGRAMHASLYDRNTGGA